MPRKINIIGGGPSGLMAATILSNNNYDVTIYDRKPSFGRKFLLAGRGGLNITHSENKEEFLKKFGKSAIFFRSILENFSQEDLKDWCKKLGENTFVGSSGRVFPKSFKASPLLRSWLSLLKKQKVNFKTNHDWLGWEEDKLIFKSGNKFIYVEPDLTLLSLGGLSWPKLGSDGSWIKILEKHKIKISKVQPSNCGFFVKWSTIFEQRFAGMPLKSVKLSFSESRIKGEFLITKGGIEGGVIYTLSSKLRDSIKTKGSAELLIDLKPDLNLKEIIKRLSKPRLKSTMSNYLRKTINLSSVAIGLLMEVHNKMNINNFSSQELAFSIKNLKLVLQNPFPIERCISTSGGVSFNSIDKNFMLINKPNTYVAGEMLDWEAPTGGYLLQGCISNGAFVAKSIIQRELD